jgi:hypothetical protein
LFKINAAKVEKIKQQKSQERLPNQISHQYNCTIKGKHDQYNYYIGRKFKWVIAVFLHRREIVWVFLKIPFSLGLRTRISRSYALKSKLMLKFLLKKSKN